MLSKQLNLPQLITVGSGEGALFQAAQRTDGGTDVYQELVDVLKKQSGNQEGLSQLQPQRVCEKSPTGRLPPQELFKWEKQSGVERRGKKQLSGPGKGDSSCCPSL